MDKMAVGYIAQLTAAAPMPPPGFQGCTFSNTVQIDGAELAALRKDAERYRWLRNRLNGSDFTAGACIDMWDDYGICNQLTGDAADAAIDAAMAAAPAVGAA